MTVSMLSLYRQMGGGDADFLRIFEATGAFIGIIGAGSAGVAGAGAAGALIVGSAPEESVP